jgi:hypothetical protein
MHYVETGWWSERFLQFVLTDEKKILKTMEWDCEVETSFICFRMALSNAWLGALERE